MDFKANPELMYMKIALSILECVKEGEARLSSRRRAAWGIWKCEFENRLLSHIHTHIILWPGQARKANRNTVPLSCKSCTS